MPEQGKLKKYKSDEESIRNLQLHLAWRIIVTWKFHVCTNKGPQSIGVIIQHAEMG